MAARKQNIWLNFGRRATICCYSYKICVHVFQNGDEFVGKRDALLPPDN